MSITAAESDEYEKGLEELREAAHQEIDRRYEDPEKSARIHEIFRELDRQDRRALDLMFNPTGNPENNAAINEDINSKKKQLEREFQIITTVSAPISRPHTTAVRAHRQQRHSASRRSSAKSGDSGDGDADPDPERHRQPEQYYTYRNFAQKRDCAEQTIRNLVSSGRLPRPVQTMAGPRFTQEHFDVFDNALSSPSEKQRRGRPRIAQKARGGAR